MAPAGPPQLKVFGWPGSGCQAGVTVLLLQVGHGVTLGGKSDV